VATEHSQHDVDADGGANADGVPVNRLTEAHPPAADAQENARQETDDEVTAPLDRPPNRPPEIHLLAAAEPLAPAVASSRFDSLRRIGEGAFGVVISPEIWRPMKRWP
jgi:hypothetical protein